MCAKPTKQMGGIPSFPSGSNTASCDSDGPGPGS